MKSSPDIAIYLHSLAGGGAEKVAVTLANAFYAKGISTHIVLNRLEGVYVNQVSSNIRLIDLKANNPLDAFLRLRDYIKRYQPTIILSLLTKCNANLLMQSKTLNCKCKIVITEHQGISTYIRNTDNLMKKIFYASLSSLYRKSDAIVAVSKGVADELAQFFSIPRELINIIYNPFDIEHIQQLASEPLDHPWFAPAEPPVILAAGRLEKEKDFVTLITAFVKLRQQQRMRLIILGEGRLRPYLENYAKSLGLTQNDIALPGFVKNPFAYMSHASVFVLSSRWEGFGNVLVEAMACGTRVVSTDCPSGPSEILENGKWGRLVPVGDADGLASAIAEALDDSTPPNVQQRALDFSTDKIVNQYLQILFPDKL